MKTEENYYERRLDKLFGKGTIWRHRTFRTVLDPYSTEWTLTSIEKKLNYLELLINSGEDLAQFINEYEIRYLEQNRSDIAGSVKDALIILFLNKLK